MNVISVDAVRDRSGARWPRKREQVEAFVERAFARAAGTEVLVVALNDAEFLAIQPGAERQKALHLSFRVLKETLAFFLGEALREDMRLLQVTGFRGGELQVELLQGARFDELADASDAHEAAGAAGRGRPRRRRAADDRPRRADHARRQARGHRRSTDPRGLWDRAHLEHRPAGGDRLPPGAAADRGGNRGPDRCPGPFPQGGRAAGPGRPGVCGRRDLGRPGARRALCDPCRRALPGPRRLKRPLPRPASPARPVRRGEAPDRPRPHGLAGRPSPEPDGGTGLGSRARLSRGAGARAVRRRRP